MRPFRSFSIACLLLLLSACSTPETTRPVNIAGGKTIGIRFGPEGPVSGKSNGYESKQVMLMAGASPQQMLYKFSFTAPVGVKLSRVRVDDISEEQSLPLFDDKQPWQDENRWSGESALIDAKDPHFTWMYTVTLSMRVYRYIITDDKGNMTVLYQVTTYPDFVKSVIRKQWGEKY